METSEFGDLSGDFENEASKNRGVNGENEYILEMNRGFSRDVLNVLRNVVGHLGLHACVVRVSRFVNFCTVYGCGSRGDIYRKSFLLYTCSH